jgi:DNA polymerase I-like protein with 3'-5' exonuclease and polymerase domains
MVKRAQVTPYNFHDAQTLRYLLDEHNPLSLKANTRRLLNIETDELEQIKAAKKLVKKTHGIRYEKDVGYQLLPTDLVARYAAKDAEFTFLLFELLWPQLPEGLLRLYHMELEFLLVLLDMETKGMKVRVDYLKEKEEEYRRRIFHTELELRELAEDDEFNPNSTVQLAAALNRRGISVPNTSKDTLSTVADPLAAGVVRLRHDRKLHGTYLEGLLAEQRDGLVHPHFNPAKTKTGRLSSGSGSN